MRSAVLLVACLVAVCSAYKSGAPTETCGDMTPQHGVPPQTGRSPYKVKLSRNRIKAGETVDITLSGGSSDSFKGFLIQARVGNTPIGRFTVGKEGKTVDCGTAKQNAVTHSSPDVKKSVKVSWTAPRDLKEKVVIYYTAAKDGATYWVAQKSEAITVQ